jgi:hypothetical protein
VGSCSRDRLRLGLHLGGLLDACESALACVLQAGAEKREVDMASVVGTRAHRLLPLVPGSQYVVTLSVLRVDPARRVRIVLSMADDPRRGTSTREGDLRPTFSGTMRPTDRSPFPPLHYQCYPPVG